MAPEPSASLHKMAAIAKNRNNLSSFQLLVWFRPNFTEVTSIKLSCACHQHVPLSCTKWPSNLKTECLCPAFMGQTADFFKILHRSDHYYTGCAYHRHTTHYCTKYPKNCNASKTIKYWEFVFKSFWSEVRFTEMLYFDFFIPGTAALNPKSQGRISMISVTFIAIANTTPTIIGVVIVVLLNPGT